MGLMIFYKWGLNEMMFSWEKRIDNISMSVEGKHYLPISIFFWFCISTPSFFFFLNNRILSYNLASLKSSYLYGPMQKLQSPTEGTLLLPWTGSLWEKQFYTHSFASPAVSMGSNRNQEPILWSEGRVLEFRKKPPC